MGEAGAAAAASDSPSGGPQTAGPWLRYGGGCGPGEDYWLGSVLFAERLKGAPLAARTAAAAATQAAPVPAPTAAAVQQGDAPDAAAAEAAATAAAAAAAADSQQHTFAGAAAEPPPPAAAAASREQPQPPTLQLVDASSTGEQQVASVLLDSVCGWAFWRFDLRLPLTAWQRAVSYRVRSAGGSCTRESAFWLPALQQPMHWGFQRCGDVSEDAAAAVAHGIASLPLPAALLQGDRCVPSPHPPTPPRSCNGFSASIPADAPEREDPTYLWRDLLQLHSAFPLHCLVGGGALRCAALRCTQHRTLRYKGSLLRPAVAAGRVPGAAADSAGVRSCWPACSHRAAVGPLTPRTRRPGVQRPSVQARGIASAARLGPAADAVSGARLASQRRVRCPACHAALPLPQCAHGARAQPDFSPACTAARSWRLRGRRRWRSRPRPRTSRCAGLRGLASEGGGPFDGGPCLLACTDLHQAAFRGTQPPPSSLQQLRLSHRIPPAPPFPPPACRRRAADLPGHLHAAGRGRGPGLHPPGHDVGW